MLATVGGLTAVDGSRTSFTTCTTERLDATSNMSDGSVATPLESAVATTYNISCKSSSLTLFRSGDRGRIIFEVRSGRLRLSIWTSTISVFITACSFGSTDSKTVGSVGMPVSIEISLARGDSIGADVIVADGVETRGGTGSSADTDLGEAEVLDASGSGWSVRILRANADSGIAPGLKGWIPTSTKPSCYIFWCKRLVPSLGHQRGKAPSVHLVKAVFLQELGTCFIKIVVEWSEDRSIKGL